MTDAIAVLQLYRSQVAAPVPAVNHVTIQCQCERLQAAPTHDSGDIELVIAVPGHGLHVRTDCD